MTERERRVVDAIVAEFEAEPADEATARALGVPWRPPAILRDRDGNALYWNGNTLMLQLSGGDVRTIGTLDAKRHTLIVKRGAQHVFRKTASFGFNFHALKSTRFNYVAVQTGRDTLGISVDDIKTFGSFMHFKHKDEPDKQSFELQIFVPLNRFKKISL